jgi:hypothetical protein
MPGEHLDISSSNETRAWASEACYERGQTPDVFFSNGALYYVPLFVLFDIAIDTDTDTDTNRHPPARPSMLFYTSFARLNPSSSSSSRY